MTHKNTVYPTPLVVLFSLICLGGILAGCQGIPIPAIMQSSSSTIMQSSSPIIMTDDMLQEMVQDYKDNYITANKKWAEKRYAITGTLTIIREEEPESYKPPATYNSGAYSIHMKLGPVETEDLNKPSFAVDLGTGSKQIIESVKVGDVVTATGTLDSRNNSFTVMRIFFLRNGVFSKVTKSQN
jgi:hypothetical protein